MVAGDHVLSERRRDGASSLRTAILSNRTQLRAYAHFAVKDEWIEGRPAGIVRVGSSSPPTRKRMRGITVLAGHRSHRHGGGSQPSCR